MLTQVLDSTSQISLDIVHSHWRMSPQPSSTGWSEHVSPHVMGMQMHRLSWQIKSGSIRQLPLCLPQGIGLPQPSSTDPHSIPRLQPVLKGTHELIPAGGTGTLGTPACPGTAGCPGMPG